MAAGDIALWTDIANLVNRPFVRLVQQAAQSIPSNASTALTFGAGSEIYDSHNMHDTVTNNTRITPTVPGWYRLTVTYWSAGATTMTAMYAAVAKNGVQVDPINRPRQDPVTTTTAPSAQVVTTIDANGTTDYFEAMANQVDSGAAARLTTTGVGTRPVFECIYERPL